MSLNHYYLLGRSGLRVSRLALGTMTFGNAGIRGIGGSWGSDEAAARAIFHRYVDSKAAHSAPVEAMQASAFCSISQSRKSSVPRFGGRCAGMMMWTARPE
jgi:hypothetical protein